MSNTITIKDSKGNVVCSVESTVPVQHSSDLFAIVEEAQKTIESYRLECAKYANALQVMSTESFGENEKNIATEQAVINAVETIATRVDLEKCHIDQVFDLVKKENGKTINLPFNVVAVKEYDKIAFYLNQSENIETTDFQLGKIFLNHVDDKK